MGVEMSRYNVWYGRKGEFSKYVEVGENGDYWFKNL